MKLYWSIYNIHDGKEEKKKKKKKNYQRVAKLSSAFM